MSLSGALPVPAVILWEIFPDMGSIRSSTITTSFGFSGAARCRGYERTHVIIPSFCVPDGSFGMEETKQYLRARSRGSADVKPHCCFWNMEQLNPMVGSRRKRLPLQF